MVKAIGRGAMTKLSLVLTMTAFSFPAFAAGIDSHAYTCASLHALIAANRFVFIHTISFQDFVVSDASYCGGGEYLQLRSVPTSDNPQCLVNYCMSRGFYN
jgi:hypothetical protein